MNVLLNTDINGNIRNLLSIRNMGYTDVDDKNNNIIFSMIQGVKTGMDVNFTGVMNRLRVSNVPALVNGNIDQTARDWLSKNVQTLMDKDKLFKVILEKSKKKPDYIPETYTFNSLLDPEIENIFKNSDNLWWVKATSGAGQIGQALVSNYNDVLEHNDKFNQSSLFNRGFNMYTNWQIQEHVKSGIGLEHFLRIPFVIINDKVNKEFSMYMLYDHQIQPPPSAIQKYYKQYSLDILSYSKHANNDCSTRNFITKKYGQKNWIKLQNNIKNMFKDIFTKVDAHNLKTSAKKYCFQLGCSDVIIGEDFKPKFLEFGFSCGGYPFPLGARKLTSLQYGCYHKNRDDILSQFLDAIFEKTLDKVKKPNNYKYLYKFTNNDLVIKYKYSKSKRKTNRKTNRKSRKR